MENRKYVTLYDPSEHVKTVHKCDLPDLKARGHNIWWKTIVECEECAQKWHAHVFDTRSDNHWSKLRWYHFKLQRSLRR